MSRELSRKRQRLAAIAGFGVFWGAFLVTIGFRPLHVVILIGGLVGVAALALEGPEAAAWLRPRLRQAGAWAARRGHATGTAALRGSRAASARVARIDWQGLRLSARQRGESAARFGRRGAVTAGGLAATASRRTLAAGGAVATAVATAAEEQARTVRRELADARRRSDALRLNEQAASLRLEGRYEEALEASERALEIFRALGDRRSEALTLNGIGLTQARAGDETGALDSYETAVAYLSELGDTHGAGRVLANLGALHLGQGQDDQARAVWQDALERLEPGSPEHDQTAQKLRSAG